MLLLGIGLLWSSAAKAGELLSLEKYPEFQGVGDALLSKDGTSIAYTQSKMDESDGYRFRGDIFVQTLGDDRRTHLGGGDLLNWTPNGLLWFIDNESRLVRYNISTKRKKRIFALPSDAVGVVVSPDQQKVAFSRYVETPLEKLYTLPPHIAKTATLPVPFDTTDLHHQRDGVELVPPGTWYLYIGDIKTGRTEQLSGWNDVRLGWSDSGLAYPVSIVWSPDGRSIFFDGDLREDHDLGAWYSSVFEISLDNGEVTELAQCASGFPSFELQEGSPNGRYLTLLGGCIDDLYTQTPNEVWIIDRDEGVQRQLTNLDSIAIGYFFDMGWRSDDEIVFSAATRGDGCLYGVSVAGCTEELHCSTVGDYWSLSDIVGDSIVGVRSGLSTFPQIEMKSLSDLHSADVLVDPRGAAFQNVQLGGVRKLNFKSTFDGRDLVGWMITPPDFDPAKRYPVLLRPDAHVGFSYELQNFAANGYIVLIVHYRSEQAGASFGTAFRFELEPSLTSDRLTADITSAIEHIKQYPYVDDQRFFISGSSQGGRVTAWMITQTDMFQAAVVQRPGGINLLSVALETDDVGYAMSRMPQNMWENPEPWMQGSVITYADQITTPTLLITGEDDLRTPMSKTVELYSAIKLLGKADARLLRMDGVSHGWGNDAATFMHLQGNALGWLSRYNDKAFQLEGRNGGP
ncbi:MAG: prolyl oligopeptidase family serine peptidase [Pseudomonadota bacterium]